MSWLDNATNGFQQEYTSAEVKGNEDEIFMENVLAMTKKGGST